MRLREFVEAFLFDADLKVALMGEPPVAVVPASGKPSRSRELMAYELWFLMDLPVALWRWDMASGALEVHLSAWDDDGTLLEEIQHAREEWRFCSELLD